MKELNILPCLRGILIKGHGEVVPYQNVCRARRKRI